MKRDLAISSINYAFVFLCSLVVFKLAAAHFGPAGFGEYTLARRAASFMQPILLMGLSVGLVRYIAISHAGAGDVPRRASYVIIGCTAITAFSLLVLALVNLAPGLFSKLVFGKTGYEDMVLPISFFCESYIVNTLVFACYRGKGEFVTANIIMAFSQGIVPLIALILSDRVADALWMTGAGTLAVSMAFSVPVVKESAPHARGAYLASSLTELARYGLPRVPGDLAMGGLLALPAFLTANLFGVKEAGYVALGVSLVGMVGSIFGPVGFVTLPKLSSIKSEGRHEEARVIIKKIIAFTFFISVLATVGLMVFGGYLVGYWLGPEFAASAGIIRLVMLASIPNALFVSLRSPINAASVKALNSTNVYKALGASAIAYLVVETGHIGLVGIPLSFVLGMAVLCILSLKVSLNLYGFNLKWASMRA